MKRYVDPLFFAFLLVIDLVAWLVVSFSHMLPEGDINVMPTVTVAVVVVIAAPVLASLALIALGRVLSKIEPKRFWGALSVISLIFTIFTAIAFLVTSQMSLQVGFATGVWFMGIATLCSVVALFLAVVGAIPAPGTISEETVVSDTDRENSSLTTETPDSLDVSVTTNEYSPEQIITDLKETISEEER